MAKTTQTNLADAIRSYVAKAPESVSFIHRCLREDGWRNLGNLSDFERTCRELGFSVREGRNERNQRRIEVALVSAEVAS